MADKDLQQIIERAVAQVLDRHLPKLQSELVERVLAELPAASSAAGAGSPVQVAATHSHLVQAVASVQAGSTQKEILRALLDAGAAYGSRVALFVVKAGAANGWQGRGFAEDDAIKDFPLDASTGPVAHAYQNRVATPGNIAEMDQRFIQRFGGPQNEQVLVLPLVLKDKVAALLYADGGAGGPLDTSSLELLVMSTSAWLEVASLRKQSQKDGEAAVPTMPVAPIAPPAPVQTVSSFSDPFAAQQPKHVAAKPAPAPVPEPEPEPAAEVVEVSTHAAAASAAAPATAADPFAGLSAEDATLIAKRSASRACSWTRSSSTTRQRLRKAAAIKIFMID
jgi:hypothetical protein